MRCRNEGGMYLVPDVATELAGAVVVKLLLLLLLLLLAAVAGTDDRSKEVAEIAFAAGRAAPASARRQTSDWVDSTRDVPDDPLAR